MSARKSDSQLLIDLAFAIAHEHRVRTSHRGDADSPRECETCMALNGVFDELEQRSYDDIEIQQEEHGADQ